MATKAQLREAENRIASVKSYEYNLLSLASLGLTTAELKELLPDIASLANLKYLHLINNQLTTLPPEIGKLVNLELLNIEDNQLTTLPPELGKLVNLKTLDLEHNRLTILPPELGELKTLEWFCLRGNQLTTLPAEIGKLANLEWLNIDYNQLTTLPPELGKLLNLEEFYLECNQLTTLPPELGKLLNLKEFNLEYNQLTDLPQVLHQLPKLKFVSLDDNPGISEVVSFLMDIKLNIKQSAENLTINLADLQTVFGAEGNCFILRNCRLENVTFSVPDEVVVQLDGCTLDMATFKAMNYGSAIQTFIVANNVDIYETPITDASENNPYRKLLLDKADALNKASTNVSNNGGFAEKEGQRKQMRLDGRFH